MRNHEVTQQQFLLNEDGMIAEAGWSRNQVQDYRRSMIKAPSFRIKEWDYYLILSREFGLALTVSDDGYIGLQSASFLWFGDQPHEHTETVLTPFPMGKLHLPENSAKGETRYEDKRLQMIFSVSDHTRHLSVNFENFHEGKRLQAEIDLEQPDMDSMVIATPWAKKHHFYYNQKINCMRASGTVRVGEESYVFDPATDFGTLDWGRGVWTYDNTWYWGNGNLDLNGHAVGFNIGYGFGDTRAASENVIFCDGKAHKLDDVRFCIPNDDGPDPLRDQGKEVPPGGCGSMDSPHYMAPWTFTSSDHRFEMEFVPVLDRSAKIDIGLICSDQHQVFGRMSGHMILDDGKDLEIRDLLCFAEKVHNRY